MNNNRESRLSFDGPHIEALCLEQAKDYPLQGEWIVANLSSRAATFQSPVRGLLRPWSSVRIGAVPVAEAERLVLLRIRKTTNLGNVVLDATWRLFATTIGDPHSPFPRDTPLWMSSQDTLGEVELDPVWFTHQRQCPEDTTTYLLKVNLWFAPSQTDCFIHNHADNPFLEVHTQVHGTARMQKFLTQSDTSLYEETVLCPGVTHPPFAVMDGDLELYPWHRYFADTDCIWMAIELHRKLSA